MGSCHPRSAGKLSLGRLDRGELSPSRGVEPDHAGDHGKQRVIAAPANAGPRVDPGSPLANDDRSCLDGLAAEQLDAETLGLAVPAVPGSGGTLLVSHGASSVADAWLRRLSLARASAHRGGARRMPQYPPPVFNYGKSTPSIYAAGVVDLPKQR